MPILWNPLAKAAGDQRVPAPLWWEEKTVAEGREGAQRPWQEEIAVAEGREGPQCPWRRVFSLSVGRGWISGGVPGTPSVALKGFWGRGSGPGPGLQSGPGPPLGV